MTNCPFATQATLCPRRSFLDGAGKASRNTMLAMILTGSLALPGCVGTDTESPITAARTETGGVTVPGETDANPSREWDNVVESGGWQIGWDDSRAVAQRAEASSRRVTLYEQPEPSEECDYDELKGRVLSVVGSLVSFETTNGWYCEGNVRPGIVTRFRTIDLHTGAVVDIRRLVPDSTIVTALKQDGLVKEALDGHDPEDLSGLIDQADGGCDVSFWYLATSFAFYELRGDKVAVRFGLEHGCAVMQGSLNEIEIELPVPEGLDVEDAEARGHLMNSLAPGQLRRETLR
ncbi:MAG: hypothetical protein OXF56_15135 [Rhodobacteraceae bacterium]|nr:hypothetical protein [Paracoccaceae bacterium]